MAFDELRAARAKRTVEDFIERWRLSEDVRDEFDLGFRIDGDDQSVVIDEIRPHWQDPEDKMQTPVATMKYIERRDIWKLYWIRADGDWHKYNPAAEVGSLEKALEIVDEDDNHCFWG